jgi:hypothetical protein
MIILTTENVLSQTFYCIPRSVAFNVLLLTDESTNETINVPIIANQSASYVHEVEAIFNLVENRFYMLELQGGGQRLFLDKVFCTNQAISSFSVNQGQYVVHNTNNEFIIYE